MLHRSTRTAASAAMAARGIAQLGARTMASGTAVPITVARGDGIGPEIMDATLSILEGAGAALKPEFIEVGEKLYRSGNTAGISDDSWESLRRTKVFLKAPITTPTGGGYKSLNVTIRKTLGLYANVRPCVSYAPFVPTGRPGIDTVIVRENEEDLYAGIEHRQTDEVYQCLKVLSRPGTEKIVRYAFDYARANGRKRVTCMVKDNIMKLSDGMFYKVFEEIGKAEYPDIKRDRMIIDIGAAMLADQPQKFDVIVTLNLYGDIISDIAAQVTGSVGLGGSANIGDSIAMFEAVHGSAPDIAGKDMANPSGLLLGAVQMLNHIGQPAAASTVYNAWAKTLEDGIHTGDIFREGSSKARVGTRGFARAVVERLGVKPAHIPAAAFTGESAAPKATAAGVTKWVSPPQEKLLHGVDIFLNWQGGVSGGGDALAAKVAAATSSVPGISLKLITNRGVKVWPGGFPETFTADHWRCRFRPADKHGVIDYSTILGLLGNLHKAGLDVIKTENLCLFKNTNGTIDLGFSLGQGE